MKTALRRISVGVSTFFLSYVLMGLVSSPVREGILKATYPGSETVSALWEIYVNAGQPVWKAVGWTLLNTHWIPLRVAPEPNVIGWVSPVMLSGNDWLYVVPIVACVIGGIVGSHIDTEAHPVEWAIGSYMAIGYTLTAVLSVFVFQLTHGEATIQVALINRVSLVWPLNLVGIPLLFGTLGAFIGRSPAIAEVQAMVADWRAKYND